MGRHSGGGATRRRSAGSRQAAWLRVVRRRASRFRDPERWREEGRRRQARRVGQGGGIPRGGAGRSGLRGLSAVASPSISWQTWGCRLGSAAAAIIVAAWQSSSKDTEEIPCVLELFLLASLMFDDMPKRRAAEIGTPGVLAVVFELLEMEHLCKKQNRFGYKVALAKDMVLFCFPTIE